MEKIFTINRVVSRGSILAWRVPLLLVKVVLVQHQMTWQEPPEKFGEHYQVHQSTRGHWKR